MALLRTPCLTAILMFLSAAAVARTEVVIEINDTASDIDDYFCWSPVTARIRAITEGDESIPVTLKSFSSTGAAVEFSRMSGLPVSARTYSPANHLDLSLPSDGSWVPFLVSGAMASADGKDVTIRAERPDTGETLGEIAVMVRVRKNADTLGSLERDRFLEAIARLHGHRRTVGPSTSYYKYAAAHGMAFSDGIHGAPDGFPLFLAWHRAFLLSLERELQDIDPRATIPYWRFDQDSDKVFVENFMGRVSGPGTPSGTQVRFASTNPLVGWRMASGGPLVRTGNPTVALQKVFSSAVFETLDNIFLNEKIQVYGGSEPHLGLNGQIEARHHNYAHVDAGGWLNTGGSPRDPLFFLLHANVDRAWAEWQARFSRFDSSSRKSYSYQGTYPGRTSTNRFRKGSYAQDEMWPWSRDDGSSTPGDPEDDWPDKGFEFPVSPAGFGPAGPTTPASMVDYMNVSGNGRAHGVCYDDLHYR